LNLALMVVNEQAFKSAAGLSTPDEPGAVAFWPACLRSLLMRRLLPLWWIDPAVSSEKRMSSRCTGVVFRSRR
jgi:hypothetical protein